MWGIQCCSTQKKCHESQTISYKSIKKLSVNSKEGKFLVKFANTNVTCLEIICKNVKDFLEKITEREK